MLKYSKTIVFHSGLTFVSSSNKSQVVSFASVSSIAFTLSNKCNFVQFCIAKGAAELYEVSEGGAGFIIYRFVLF